MFCIKKIFVFAGLYIFSFFTQSAQKTIFSSENISGSLTFKNLSFQDRETLQEITALNQNSYDLQKNYRVQTTFSRLKEVSHKLGILALKKEEKLKREDLTQQEESKRESLKILEENLKMRTKALRLCCLPI